MISWVRESDKEIDGNEHFECMEIVYIIIIVLVKQM